MQPTSETSSFFLRVAREAGETKTPTRGEGTAGAIISSCHRDAPWEKKGSCILHAHCRKQRQSQKICPRHSLSRSSLQLAVICQPWCVQHAVGGWVTMHQNNWLPSEPSCVRWTSTIIKLNQQCILLEAVSSPSKCKGRSYTEGRGTQSSLLAFRLERFGGSHQEKNNYFKQYSEKKGQWKWR